MVADKFLNITTLTTTIIPNLGNKWCLEKIIFNKKGASSNTLTIYDSNDTLKDDPSLKIGTIDTTDKIDSLEYELILKNGFYAVTATGTAADITVILREIA